MNREPIQTMKQKEFIIGTKPISITDVALVSRKGDTRVRCGPIVAERMEESHSYLETMFRGDDCPEVYGLNTGVGFKSGIRLNSTDSVRHQEEVVSTHAGGVGHPLKEDIVRGAMFLLANSLSKGYSGVRYEVVQRLTEFLNNDITPIVPSKGSVGSSGDLSPLSHLALCLFTIERNGKRICGDVKWDGRITTCDEALQKTGLPPIKLSNREGVAVINGPWISLSTAALTVFDALRLLKHADMAAAMSIEAVRGFLSPFCSFRPIENMKGHERTSRNILRLLRESSLARSVEMVQNAGSVLKEFGKVQDSYSIRCIPQVHGTVKEMVRSVKEIIEAVLNSVLDNPIVLVEMPWHNKVLSWGNPHGEPIAAATDMLCIALAEIGNISERRIAQLIYPRNNHGRPPLTENEYSSRLMIAQYTAASLVSENKILAHPASVDSIPTSGHVEDYNSMASIAAHKANDIKDNVKRILGAEYLVAAGCLHRLMKNEDREQLGAGTGFLYEQIKRRCDLDSADIPGEQIERLAERMIEDEDVLQGIQGKIGDLEL